MTSVGMENDFYQHYPFSRTFCERAVVSDDQPFFMLMVMTGTLEKYINAYSVWKSASPAIAREIYHYSDAGRAPEPVTPSMEHLIFGKQDGHRKLLIASLDSDPEYRKKYHRKRIVLAANDINTKVEGRPLTKTKIQKEHDLDREGYRALISSSLKYLLAEVNGLLVPGDPSWDELTADLDKLREFDQTVDTRFKSNERYLLPIDFQATDAFEAIDVDAPGYRKPKLTQVGPRILVVHRSYASIAFDVDENGVMSNFNSAVNHYLWRTLESMEKNRFSLGRCPLGIYWAELFNSMTVKGAEVVLSVAGHREPTVSLVDKKILADNCYSHDNITEYHAHNKALEDTYESLERKQDGFSRESFDLAMQVFRNTPKKSSHNVVTIMCKPGTNPVYEYKKLN